MYIIKVYIELQSTGHIECSKCSEVFDSFDDACKVVQAINKGLRMIYTHDEAQAVVKELSGAITSRNNPNQVELVFS